MIAVRGSGCRVRRSRSEFSVLSSEFRPRRCAGADQQREDRDPIGRAGPRTRSARRGGAPRRHLDRLPDADGRRSAPDVLLRHHLGLVVFGRHVPPRQRRRRVDEHRRPARPQRITGDARTGHGVPGAGAAGGRRRHPRPNVHARLRHRRHRAAADLADRRQARRQRRLAGVARRRRARQRRPSRSRRQDGDERRGAAQRAGRRPRARALRRRRQARNGCAATPRSGSATPAANPARACWRA